MQRMVYPKFKPPRHAIVRQARWSDMLIRHTMKGETQAEQRGVHELGRRPVQMFRDQEGQPKAAK
ncbi:MAG: hypothetical protein ABS36_12745 [Acidobacteria bacterium SCN 69-37]|nr:MAG: hypothetical protein ABS36_12745 [Acidobacteria bacterium SCN 69-37]